MHINQLQREQPVTGELQQVQIEIRFEDENGQLSTESRPMHGFTSRRRMVQSTLQALLNR